MFYILLSNVETLPRSCNIWVLEFVYYDSLPSYILAFLWMLFCHIRRQCHYSLIITVTFIYYLDKLFLSLSPRHNFENAYNGTDALTTKVRNYKIKATWNVIKND